MYIKSVVHCIKLNGRDITQNLPMTIFSLWSLLEIDRVKIKAKTEKESAKLSKKFFSVMCV